MSLVLGTINEREIRYLEPVADFRWESYLPDKNWLAFVIGDQEQIPLPDNIAKVCVDKNALYSCGVGDASSAIDDAFDWEIITRKLNSDEQNIICCMTTWHNDFNEGFWFATQVAYHETIPIEQVVCINLTTRNYCYEISVLISKINDGWSPSN